MFVDEAIIDVSGGNGGRGCVSWRREKYVAKGGPDGGDGGHGGDVWLVAEGNTDTLSNYRSTKRFSAQKGRFGMGKNKRGKDGDDLELKVPPGTLVYSEDRADQGELVVDLAAAGDRYLVARGGRGGYGNAHFATATRQRPDFAELGEPGEQRSVRLELKLVADVGIIGFPSVGKSTLISVISNAKPKIADYPFTTLVPNLGVVNVDDRTYVVCDVPGLIEGASEGKGLGDQFLKHIERCQLLLHVLDLSRALREGGELDPSVLIEDYQTIRAELTKHSPALAEKKELVVLNKVDLTTNDLEPLRGALKKEGIALFAEISAATTQGAEELKKQLLPIVLDERQRAASEAQPSKLPVLRPHEQAGKMGAFRLETKEDGTIVVHGQRIEQLTKMTDFSSEGGVKRWRDVLERTGILKAIEQQRADEETKVVIGEVEVEEYF